MLCFCRARLFRIGSALLIALSSFVLFDLLDIDGSNFKPSTEFCTVGEDPAANDEVTKAPAQDLPVRWLAIARTRPLASIALLEGGASRRLPALGVRPRRATAQEGAPADRDSDPALHAA